MHPVMISHWFRPMMLRWHPATGDACLSQKAAFHPQLVRLARTPAMLRRAGPELATAAGPHFFARRLRRNAGTSMPLLGGARAGVLPIASALVNMGTVVRVGTAVDTFGFCRRISEYQVVLLRIISIGKAMFVHRPLQCGR